MSSAAIGKALVLGAQGAMGAALYEALRQRADVAQVRGFSRRSQPALQLEDESSIAACAAEAASDGAFHWIIDATGALSIDGRGPEKRLQALDSAALMRSLQVNAVGPALLMKHFVPLLARDTRAVFATLSARVGSIEDNHRGGWWSYRASKAALNMLLQTTAIEAARQRPLAVFAALQPGTVRSPLSAPFADPAQTISPADSARCLLDVLDGLPPSPRAQFVDYRGQRIPW